MTLMKLQNMAFRKKEIRTQQIDDNNEGINRNIIKRNKIQYIPKTLLYV